jgi:uncharacterized membrane protein
MLGLTPVGVVHTAVALVGLVSGFWALARYKEISLRNALGQCYVVTTFLSAVTALFIYQHGVFGPGHVLAVLTLIALAVGTLAKRSRRVQAICFTSTILFHLIPGFTETLTRIPSGAPILPNQEAPELRVIAGVLVVLLAIGLALQLRWLRRQTPSPG